MARAPSAQFVLLFKISHALFELLYFLFSLKCDAGLLDDMRKAILCVYHFIVYMPPSSYIIHIWTANCAMYYFHVNVTVFTHVG